MAKSNVQNILADLNAGKITMSAAAALLSPTRKLRGVSVTPEQSDAFLAFVQDGDFRVYCDTVKLSTAGAQALLGRSVRAAYEKIEG